MKENTSNTPNKYVSGEKGRSEHAIDAFRDTFHINWIEQKDFSQMLTAQSYRPEIIEAIHQITALPRWKKLNDVCEGNIVPGRGPIYSDTGVPCLKTKNIQTILVDTETEQYVSKDYASKNHKLRIPFDSILMNLSGAGSIGRVGLYLKKNLPITNQHLVRFEVAASIDAAYVVIFLSTWWGERAIEQGISGSTGQLWINQDQVKDLPIALPSENIQQGIGNKVRMAERLRELITFGEDRFSIWINLSANKASLNPKCYKYLDHSPENTSPDNSWVDNFDPADRVDPWPHHIAPRSIRNHLEKLNIFKSFSDFFTIESSNRSRKSLNDSHRQAYHISVLDIDTSGNVDWNSAGVNRYEGSGVEVRAGDILYSCLNPRDPRVCVIPNTHEILTVASPEFVILRIQENAPELPYLLTALLRSKWVRVQASFLTRSSSLSRRRLQEFDLHRLLIPWRPYDAEKMDELLKKCISYKDESNKLIIHAKSDVEALIDGTLDEQKLLTEGEEIKQWLKDNPSPYTEERTEV